MNQEEWAMLGEAQAKVLANFSQVIVTAGKAGGQVYLGGEPTWQFSGQGDLTAVDETGAGDAFATGYVAATLLQHPPQTAIAWGVNNARSVVSYYGAKLGLLDRTQLTKLVTEN